jgi:hypothetical protein
LNGERYRHSGGRTEQNGNFSRCNFLAQLSKLAFVVRLFRE